MLHSRHQKYVQNIKNRSPVLPNTGRKLSLGLGPSFYIQKSYLKTLFKEKTAFKPQMLHSRQTWVGLLKEQSGTCVAIKVVKIIFFQ